MKVVRWVKQNGFVVGLVVITSMTAVGVVLVLNAYAKTLTYYKPLVK